MPTMILDRRGRLTIPRELRTRLGIRPGEAVDVELDHDELRVRRSADPYAHLSAQELMAEHVRALRAHPEEAAAYNAELTGWDAIPSTLPAEEWTDDDFGPASGPEAG